MTNELMKAYLNAILSVMFNRLGYGNAVCVCLEWGEGCLQLRCVQTTVYSNFTFLYKSMNQFSVCQIFWLWLDFFDEHNTEIES